MTLHHTSDTNILKAYDKAIAAMRDAIKAYDSGESLSFDALHQIGLANQLPKKLVQRNFRITQLEWHANHRTVSQSQSQ